MIYSCPMHPEVTASKRGLCPKCHMELVPKNDKSDNNMKLNQAQSEKNYKPLITILLLILIATLSLAVKDVNDGSFSFRSTMENFMAGFFLVFSGFKMLDLRGFAQAYTTYDLLAAKIPSYGLIYPIIEFCLGLLYLTKNASSSINLLTFLLMSFSGFGIIVALSKKRHFQCACLGTIIKVPLTYVTLIEDFSMASMALIAILI